MSEINLRLSSNPSSIDPELVDAFIIAAGCGEVEKVKKFISNGMPVNATNQNNLTALYLAAIMGQIEVVEYLVSRPKIDPNIKDSSGKTALEVARDKGDSEIIKLIEGITTAPSSESTEPLSAILKRVEKLRGLNFNEIWKKRHYRDYNF